MENKLHGEVADRISILEILSKTLSINKISLKTISKLKIMKKFQIKKIKKIGNL